MAEGKNYFVDLYGVDVSGHVEKKNGFSYLSWSFAVAELLRRHPDAVWDVKRFDGLPFMATDCGYFVEVGVTVSGVERTQIHPVLDHRNKPVAQPNAFDINTSIQRALVKAIALHGLGLYVYAGEDLPPDVKAEQDGKLKQALTDAANQGTEALRQAWEKLTKEQREAFKDELPGLKEAAAKVKEAA